MGYHITHRYGAMTSNPGVASFPELLAELRERAEDTEHGSVAVTHESEWCISVSLSGCVVLENLEQGEPRHMSGLSEQKILTLLALLAEGDIARLEQEAWLPGYA